MILATILFWGILTMWAPRWALSVCEAGLIALAGVSIVRRAMPGDAARGGAIRVHPIGALLAAAALWGVGQIAAHRTVYELKTWEAALGWTINLIAFSLALEYCTNIQRRERFLQATLIFAFVLAITATFTALTSPPGLVFWKFDAGTGAPTLGPFVYRNQYAAFVEAALPLAIVRALLDRRRAVIYTGVAAALFASVVVGGSRTGSILCLAEIVVTPALVYVSRWIPARSMIRGLAGSLLAIAALTMVVGWETIWNRLQEPNPYGLRADLVKSSIEMIRDRPWMGFGLGTWSTAYPGYARFDDGNFVNQAHNDWIQWAAEGGLPFVAILLAMVVLLARPALRSAWGVGILAVFVHCLVDYPMQQRPALAAFFFAMAGAVASRAAVAPGDRGTSGENPEVRIQKSE